jgi:hypothetical protein
VFASLLFSSSSHYPGKKLAMGYVDRKFMKAGTEVSRLPSSSLI